MSDAVTVQLFAGIRLALLPTRLRTESHINKLLDELGKPRPALHEQPNVCVTRAERAKRVRERERERSERAARRVHAVLGWGLGLE